MKTEFISEGRDYSLPCIYNISRCEKTVCVIVHGFSSSKESVTARMMLEELPSLGIGALAFDLPAHGKSEVNGEYLRLANCVADMKDAEIRARNLAPEAEIVYFASSFGAYITLIYLAGIKQGRRRAFLRSAAVTMPRILHNRLTPERRASLESAGELTIYKEEYGYARDMKLTKGFFDDLESHDIFTLWHESYAELCMIHGESDQTVPLYDAQAFAKKFSAPLHVVPSGDHQLSIPGAPEQVLKLASEFFQRIY